MGLEAVFDIECNGLNPDKIHCVSMRIKGKTYSTTDYDRMRDFFLKATTLIGHNIVRFDIPVVERILGIKVKARLVETLALSWYLCPKRVKHGLAEWGEEFGVPKPVVEDWDNLPIEEYTHRCESDVAINTKLWEKQIKDLLKLYGDAEKAWRLIDYLTFKMDCAREQEASRWLLDVAKCTEARDRLVGLQEEKVNELALVMPKVPIYGKLKKPAKLYKLNRELSVQGEKWFAALERNNLPADTEGVVEEVVGWKEPNPGSTPQIKDWLYSLGWEPQTFEFKRDKETGDVRQIPQVNLKHGAGVCPSIKALFVKEPGLAVLDGLSILTHRISVLNGFLANVDEDGYVQAQIQGLTNTLRFKHRVVVNLPGIDKPYGADIRGCLVCPEGFELAGSDMKALEDRTKQHYMWPHDPDYVRDMLSDDFDPHIDIAVFAGLMSQEEGDAYKAADKEFEKTPMFKALKVVRAIGKKGNYTAVYGAGDAAIARAIQRPLNEGKAFKEAYWKRNWSVMAIAAEQVVKKCLGGMWLFNPVSELWYSLRYEKDRFSTLNQGTGVWCFDLYIKNIRNGGPPLIAQMHDEWVAVVKKGNRERLKAHCQKAIDKTNEELKLNRELDFSVDFGLSYADIH
jgi:DNA polymerase III epsilon subunit-like protein